MLKIYAYVYILDTAYRIDKRYVYFLLPEQREKAEEGSLCVVPFGTGNRKQTGIISGFTDSCDYPQIKPVENILDYPVKITPELVKLCGFMKERFFCTFGSAARTILPPGINLKSRSVYKTREFDKKTLNEKGEFIYDFIDCRGIVTEKELKDEFGDEVLILVSSMIKLKALEKETEVIKKINEKNIVHYRLSSTEEAQELAGDPDRNLKSEKQKKIVEFLRHGASITLHEGEELFGAGSTVFNNLVKNGILEKFEIRSERSYKKEIEYQKSEYELNPEQKEAAAKISLLMDSGEPKAALLYGVTGSGKTKVIIEACKKCIADGKAAIVLLPEIGLTAQALGIYSSAFGDDLAVIHSMLSNGERTDTYRSIEEGKIKIAIGTRSAVFAPFKNLGLIAVDEEQEHTYKSEMSPKYHARDIARFRAAYNNALVLLCSATPSIESFYKAKMGVYELIELKNRHGGARMPECDIIDLKNEELEPDCYISPSLEAGISDTLKKEEQAILFVNRRGFSNYLSCSSCGYVYKCPNCAVSLTYHMYGRDKFKKDKLICHYCGYIATKPEKCSECGSSHIGYHGFGTQKLQDELERKFSDAKAVRMDADTTSGKYSHEEILESFSSGEYDIMFGTQMVAKGLDFPNVNLVSVLNADASLYMNDFRAGERTFSLFTQLIGRSGRGLKQGRAIIQTYNPDNEILKLAAVQDYLKFYESEILIRQAVLFPPFCDIAVFNFSSDNEDDANRSAEALGAAVSTLYTEKYTEIPLVKLGPYKDGAVKLRNKYRQQIILKYKDKAISRRFLDEAYQLLLKKAPGNVNIDLNINPVII